MPRVAVGTMLLFAVALASGCGKKGPRPDHGGLVEGVVTLDDQPLERGTITFIPALAESEGGRPGIARIESGGRYRLGNANPDKPQGVPPGRYKVTVLVMQADPTGTGDPLARCLVPEQYTSERTTPFAADVVAGTNQFAFHLRTSTTEPE